MTYGYEQPSLVGHAWVLKITTYSQRAGAKRKGQETKLRRDKNKGGRDKLPLARDFCNKANLKISMNIKLFTRGLPHECLFTKTKTLVL